MIGISIASKWEWDTTIDYYNITENMLKDFPFGKYFKLIINNKELLFYNCGARKTNSSAACQYMICKFNINKIIVIGTCAGIDDKYKPLDIFLPNKTVQIDCTVKEIEPLIKKSLTVDIDLSKYNFSYKTGTIATGDKAIVMWKDYIELKDNNITIADCESGAISYVCKMNNIECLIIKGISDFPINKDYINEKKTNEEQFNTYINNTSIIMKKIYKEYLKKVL